MKTAIYSLYQRHEYEKGCCFIDQVSDALSDQFELHILINDQDCPNLRAYAENASKHIYVHCEGLNKGVAGGRNLLIKKAINSGAEFLISCDMDIVYEYDYFGRIRDAYIAQAKVDENIGFVQPVLLDGRALKEVFPWLGESNSWGDLRRHLGALGTGRSGFWMKVTERLGGEQRLKTIYHCGVSNIWRAHFGAPPAEMRSVPWGSSQWKERYLTISPTLRGDLPALEAVMAGKKPIAVMSTAGGVSAFHKKVFESIGGYNEVFNPFGYEDSEIGFRGLNFGLNNYVLPNLFAIHDCFMGEVNRGFMSYSRLGLLRGTELAYKNYSSDDLIFAVSQSLLFCWNSILSTLSSELAAGRIKPVDLDSLLLNFALSYYFDMFRGMQASASFADGADYNNIDCLNIFRVFNGEDVELADFSIPLGLGANFRAGLLTARNRSSSQGDNILSLFASNCRIEESTSDQLLTSRYFDFSCIAKPVSLKEWSVSIDIQSDDIVYQFLLSLSFNQRPHVDGSLSLIGFDLRSKQYDFGGFSVEEIYPAPTLKASKAWLPMFKNYLSRCKNIVANPVVEAVADFLSGYLACPGTGYIDLNKSSKRKKRILLFADSRGQHKPAGCDHPIFGERLVADDRLEVDMYLCPMKWTTTLDFLERFDLDVLNSYDHVILYTGIVDWSPRKISNAYNDLYCNDASLNETNFDLNTRDYSKKIVNNKKNMFDAVFGGDAMAEHFSRPLATLYEGELTINMYGLEMAKVSLIPRLKAIRNLIFISANRFVAGWNGDYKKRRPENIDITHCYSDLFCRELVNAHVVDLRVWTDDEVKIYTCDNLHLTQKGSDYIYDRLMNIIGLPVVKNNSGKIVGVPGDIAQPAINKVFSGIASPERMVSKQKREKLLAMVGQTDFLATLIIGLRLPREDRVRWANLIYLLKWIDYYYGNLFDILLVEQDTESRFSLDELGVGDNVRHKFIFNPGEYNRGWGYNVAVKHFCPDSQVVALMDTDVLTGKNFVREIIDCYSKYDAISPYQNIYYTNAQEVAEIQRANCLDGLGDSSRIKNPVTLSGGILIIKKSVFVSLNGFEQYVGYGCEDRAFDVTLYNHLGDSRVRIAEGAYAHLFHESDATARTRFEEIYSHLTSNYGCKYDARLGPYDFIHTHCNHVPVETTSTLMNERSISFGDPDLYKYEIQPTVNGIVHAPVKGARNMDNVIFPPDFCGLDAYSAKELYANTPEPDVDELAALYNAFKGKRCFIIGNGPSLNKHNLSLLKDEYTFGVNSFFYKTRETGFKPYFYVVEDSSVMKENIEEIRRFDTPFKFFPTNYKNLHPKNENTIFFRMNRGFYEKSSPNFVVPRFSTDATKVLYCGQSVTYINLQLAYFMGFSEVYLIGMDFSYVIPTSHKRSGDVLLSDSDDPNHFHKDYFGKGKTWKDPKLDRVALNYKQAKLVYEATGRSIYNATIGGSLEIFERVDYNELLTGRKHGAGALTADVTFADANRLMIQGYLAQALSAYVELAKVEAGFFVYKRAALDCYLRAVEHDIPCNLDDVAYVRGLIVGLN